MDEARKMLDLRCAVCLIESRIEDQVIGELTDVRCPSCGAHLRLVVVPLGLMPGYDARQYNVGPGVVAGQEIVKDEDDGHA